MFAALEHGLRPSTLKSGEPLPGWSLRERMAHYHVPGVAIAVLKDGKVVQAAGCGVREAGTQEAVNADTLFSVGSVSKVVTAAKTLRRVASGKLELGVPWGSAITPTRRALTGRPHDSTRRFLAPWLCSGVLREPRRRCGLWFDASCLPGHRRIRLRRWNSRAWAWDSSARRGRHRAGRTVLPDREQQCREYYHQCIALGGEYEKRGQHGRSICKSCYDTCTAEGYWPDKVNDFECLGGF